MMTHADMGRTCILHQKATAEQWIEKKAHIYLSNRKKVLTLKYKVHKAKTYICTETYTWDHRIVIIYYNPVSKEVGTQYEMEIKQWFANFMNLYFSHNKK